MINSNAYVFERNRELLIIDSSNGEDFKDYIKKLSPKHVKVILTHEHYDHIVGVGWLKDNFDTKICSSEKVAVNVESSTRNLSKCANVLLSFYRKNENEECIIEPYTCSVDEILKDNDEIYWNNIKVRIIYTPGHTSGGICILVNEKLLFTGDTFLSIPIITRFPSGSKKDFFNTTVPLLSSMDGKDIIILPGHGEPEKLDILLKKIEVI